ncbi:MAG: protease modulator HflC [Rickettsiales bacterium]|nr:protease modulator HflC [Rickettsiales bacterium]
MSKLTLLLIVLVLGFIALVQSAFIVTQTQQALVVRFGDIQRVIQEPGLAFKVPFIDTVEFFDNRLLEFNAQPQEFITKDRRADVEERVMIDAFVRYRIVDPVRFYQAVRNESNLESRLGSVVVANMLKIIAKNSLNDLLSEKRTSIMEQIRFAVNQQATADESEITEDDELNEDGTLRRRRQGFGIEVVDVRIMRADLPEDISQATYERMRKNFTKEAQKFRAEGEEVALEIRSTAERERTEILAQAQKESETLRGEGDGVAAKIYADAFNKDRDFFEFYRSMQAYRKSLKQDDTTVILSPNSEFLKQLD